MAEIVIRWRGKQSDALLDTTPALDIEGAIRAAKTTICLWKEFNACRDFPGIHTLLARWTDDATDALLRPLWAQILRETETPATWNAKESAYEFPWGSVAYMRGLKAPDLQTRYAKFRGLTLARAYVDQAEELPEDVYRELKGRLSQNDYPHQMVISPNAVNHDHWIAREFPEDNHIPGHKLIALSVWDNAHNLSPEYLAELDRTFPAGHAKRRMMIEGQRGLNVIGEPVYGALFRRDLHLRELTLNRALPLLIGLDFGRHHPCVVWAQYTPLGGVEYLGGLLGQDLFLEDFLPIVTRMQDAWFSNPLEVRLVCDPAGAHASSQGTRANGIQVLQDHGFSPAWNETANAPDVRLAMIERLAGHLRRRTAGGDEALAVEARLDRWLRVSDHSLEPWPFLADGFEAGYVWDVHTISVSHKPTRHPKKDGWFDHGMNAIEYLELQYGGPQPSERQVEQHAYQRQQQALRRSQIDTEDVATWRRPRGSARAGYR